MKTVIDSLPMYRPEQRNYFYAGIGSRKTPDDVLLLMERLARRLAMFGYVLRDGDAEGADKAFGRGAWKKREVYLAKDATGDRRAHELVDAAHPSPASLRGYARDLMARNAYQVFGRQLDLPVDFVLCWTPDGCEHHEERTRATGGTGQAISLASLRGIPVVNMAREGWRERIAALVK